MRLAEDKIQYLAEGPGDDVPDVEYLRRTALPCWQPSRMPGIISRNRRDDLALASCGSTRGFRSDLIFVAHTLGFRGPHGSKG